MFFYIFIVFITFFIEIPEQQNTYLHIIFKGQFQSSKLQSGFFWREMLNKGIMFSNSKIIVSKILIPILTKMIVFMILFPIIEQPNWLPLNRQGTQKGRSEAHWINRPTDGHLPAPTAPLPDSASAPCHGREGGLRPPHPGGSVKGDGRVG